MSSSSPVRVERRAGQRFSYLLPVSFRDLTLGTEGVGFSQDLSSRGVFFITDSPLSEGTKVELTLNMPSEITLGECMRVRCRGHVLRVIKSLNGMSSHTTITTENKIGVAVRFEGYEYLPGSASAHVSVQSNRSSDEHDSSPPVRPGMH